MEFFHIHFSNKCNLLILIDAKRIFEKKVRNSPNDWICFIRVKVRFNLGYILCSDCVSIVNGNTSIKKR